MWLGRYVFKTAESLKTTGVVSNVARIYSIFYGNCHNLCTVGKVCVVKKKRNKDASQNFSQKIAALVTEWGNGKQFYYEGILISSVCHFPLRSSRWCLSFRKITQKVKNQFGLNFKEMLEILN